MKLLERIDNGKESVGRQSGQCKDGNTDRNVLRSFGDLTNGDTPRPRLHGVNCRGKRHAGYYHQQVSQSQRQYISGTEFR